jgi:hypothetical protein
MNDLCKDGEKGASEQQPASSQGERKEHASRVWRVCIGVGYRQPNISPPESQPTHSHGRVLVPVHMPSAAHDLYWTPKGHLKVLTSQNKAPPTHTHTEEDAATKRQQGKQK